jgi:valyl-tRNA synthetase
MDRFIARELLVEKLTSMGLYRGCDDHPMRLARCSRSGDIIEQMVKTQWFVQLHSTSDAGSCEGSPVTAAGELGGLGMASTADQMVAEGHIQVTPSWHQAEWHRWMEATKRFGDWCVSRQLWWGHRIPAYRVVLAGDHTLATTDEHWVVAKDVKEAEEKATVLFGPKLPEGLMGGGRGWHTLHQDEDVLDTWFSSALFPLTALGWPHWDPGQDTDMRKFYPLDVMETGSDILFFWVARMAMVCSTLEPNLYGQRQQQRNRESSEVSSNPQGQRNDLALAAVPFDQVLLHPVVRDKEGRKMSKSLGNVIDPLHVIHGASLETMVDDLRGTSLPEEEVDRAAGVLLKEHGEAGLAACGSDALRWALIGYMAQGRQINLDMGRVVIARQFCNKVWQASRFTLRHLEAQLNGQEIPLRSAERLLAQIDLADVKLLPLGQRWMLSRLAFAAEACNGALSLSEGNFQLAAAQGAAQQFFLNDLCDEYIEMTKIAVVDERTNNLVGNGAEASAMLYLGMDSALRMLHPFLPFITEELYQRLSFAAKRIQSQREFSGGDSHLLEPESGSGSIMTEPFPCGRMLSCLRDEMGAEQEMTTLMAVTKAVRGLQMLQGKLLPKGSDGYCTYEVRIAEDDVRGAQLLTEYADYVSARCRLNTVPAESASNGTVPGVGGGLRVVVGDERADADAEAKLGSRVGWLGVAVASVGISGSAQHTLRVCLGVQLDEEVQQKVRHEVQRLTKKSKKVTAKKDKLVKQMTTSR